MTAITTKLIGAKGGYRSLYLTADGPVVTLGDPLITGTSDVPAFDREALIAALRNDQAGKSTFPECLTASWRAVVPRLELSTARGEVLFSSEVLTDGVVLRMPVASLGVVVGTLPVEHIYDYRVVSLA